MGRYLIRRFAELILTVFLIATATFFLLEAVPGDPLTQRADHLPEQTRTALYQRYGLDKPVMERYLITMKKMCKGDCRFVGIAYFSAAFDIWTAFAEGFCR